MAFFGKRSDRVYERRLSQRDSCLKAATILTLDRSNRATIISVSSERATLSGCGDVTPGEDLWVKVGCVDRLVTITQADGDLCEVMFEEPLDHDDLIHVRCEARNTLVLRLAPEEKEAAQDWIKGLKR